MTRSTMREHIFKLLFRVEFHDSHELEEQIRLYMNELETIKDDDLKYITEKTLSIAELIPEIDDKINNVSEGWPVNRLGKAELAIMRLAVYEMLYDEDIPTGVAINEAVELAKNYGSDSAPSFINGVLAKLTK
ncbi:MAG: transcription antitermination factor NusB [Lachnospira sp.]|nr:transcription antitermination factor NusB [Lachnospira sp.]